MKARAVLVVLAAVASGAVVLGAPGAAGGEEPVNIPDAYLLSAVRAKLWGYPYYTGPIYPSDMLRLEKVDTGNIGDLTGLEYALNLRRLSTSYLSATPWNARITTLAPLTGLSKLEYVSIPFDLAGPGGPVGQLTTLGPLASSTGLTYLNAHGYQISDISALSGMTGLETLLLDNNRLADISLLAGKTALKKLWVNVNEITDLSPLAGMTSLQELKIFDNRITSLAPLSGLSSLQSLNADYNSIVDISSLPSLVSLQHVWLQVNSISEVPELSPLVDLAGLEIGGNHITDISGLSALAAVRSLGLEYNLISDISPLAYLHSLQFLYLTGNPLAPDAYSTWIPLIRQNNPGVQIWYDPLPEPCAAAVALTGALGLLVKRPARLARGQNRG